MKRFFQGIEQAFSSFAGPARQAISDAGATCLLSSCLLLYFPVAELQARGRASGLPKVSGAAGGQPSGCRQGDAAPHCPYRRVMGCIPHYELSISDSVSLYAMTVSHHEFSVLKAKGQTLQCHNQSRCRKKFFKNFLLALKMQKQLGKSDSFYMITCFYYCIKECIILSCAKVKLGARCRQFIKTLQICDCFPVLT